MNQYNIDVNGAKAKNVVKDFFRVYENAIGMLITSSDTPTCLEVSFDESLIAKIGVIAFVEVLQNFAYREHQMLLDITLVTSYKRRAFEDIPIFSFSVTERAQGTPASCLMSE